MRKWSLILVLLILCCGCGKKEFTVETIVENQNNIIAALTYPTTGISKLDKEIYRYVDISYQAFQTEYGNLYTLSQESEFNLDYQYWVTGKQYVNVVLETFINSSTLAHPIHEIKTFVYDNQKNKIITMGDLIEESKRKQLVPRLKQELWKKYKDCILLESLDAEITTDFQDMEFTLNDTSLTVYFNPYRVTSGFCGIVRVDIPLSSLGIQISKETQNVWNVVHVNKEKIIDPLKPVVAITFDDGPSKYTEEILNVLKKYDASGTFFVLGNKVKSYQDTIRLCIEQGHELGNHSYNHKWLTRLEIEDFKEQIDKTQELIFEITGHTPTLLRPTYGSVNKKIRNNTSLQIVLWDVDSLDWKIKDSKKIANRVLRDVEDMDIVLFHDTHERTVKALDLVLEELQNKGYQFVTVSELEQVKLLRHNQS